MSRIICALTYYSDFDKHHKVIWETAKECNNRKLYEDERSIILKIDDSCIFIVTDESGITDTDDEEKAKMFNKAFEFLNKEGIEPEEICYAIHEETNYNGLKEFLKIKTPNHCALSHTPSKEPFETIKTLLQLVKENSTGVSEQFDTLSKLIKKNSIIPNFSLLKYRIAHLWLPLDTDLQGIEEVKGKRINSEGTQVKYLKEMLEEKQSGPREGEECICYRQKLANLRYCIAGDINNSEVNGVSAADEFKAVIEQPLSKIIPKDESREEWEILLELTGLSDTKYITEFVKTLDEKIAKADNVSDVFDFFKDRDWKIKGANPQIIKSFHHWFCALDNCLERLRGKL